MERHRRVRLLTVALDAATALVLVWGLTGLVRSGKTVDAVLCAVVAAGVVAYRITWAGKGWR